MPANSELQQKLGSIEELLAKIDSTADPSLRASVQQLVELVMSLHGSGLERTLELVHANGEAGEAIIQKLGNDELVSSLLVLHGLHPLTLDARVAQALDKARSRLRPHGGEVDLVSLRDGAVHLRLHAANGHGCGSTPQALKEIIEESVYRAAPDVTNLTIDGAEEKAGFVPLEMLHASTVSKGGL